MEFETLTPLDEETFRRVWERVMPDQSLSPVVVRASTPPQVAPREAPSHPDIAALEGVMDGVRQWQGRLEHLSRQSGGKSALRALADGERLQLRRLDGLYFLLTGSRYLPRAGGRWDNQRGVDSLRQGFFLEMDWVCWYDDLVQTLPQIGLQEAVEELRQGALEQSRQLRTLLTLQLPQGWRDNAKKA